MPDCVTTNYLCRSDGMGCFSDLNDNQDFSQAVHGCLDFLSWDKGRTCQNVPASGTGREGSLLLCCHEDMCNHVDSPEAREKYNETILDRRKLLNDTPELSVRCRQISRMLPVAVDDDLKAFTVRSQLRLGEEGERVEYTDQDALWFRAATVAVPIFGALILLILIFLALKILRTDPQSLQPKLRVGPNTRVMIGSNNPHIDTGAKKLPLLYQHNDCTSRTQEKNEANAKLNSPATLLDLHKSSQRAPCNLYQPLIQSPQGVDASVYNKTFLIDWGAHP
ncbi:unnamed protein product [Nezara viridula]|uniref:BMP and activin membrane-bound inhibitor homolog n=1 Tax=Nezara viridula TaxID=85310 RepID=A0A9P0H6X5_NEZVI|nr:unnamed protein product [Nezara viridula]